jgi:crotonobetainyl-CoA:carnitine CoA-transferase CaiB-like acyl-CoA transferase
VPEAIARVAFEELLRAVGLPAPGAAELEIAERSPPYACRFPLDAAATASLAACGVAVSDLWELRSGRRQRVRVDSRQAAASLLSFAFARAEREPSLEERRAYATIALYRAGDGRWIHLHGGFPHLRDGTLRVLGCGDDREAIARAVGHWEAGKLEDALAEASMCGAMVRSAEEWAIHPQGRVLGERSLVEIERIGEAEPQPLGPGERPLSGIRVLDLTRVLAGPTCGRTLAEHGADVLRIGSPELPSVPGFVLDTSHGKLSAHLDLERRDDLERLRTLVGEADVFAQGYRSGSLERRGLGPAALAALRPGLIYVSMNCYGHHGPWRSRPGWEQLAQSVTGLAHDHGGPASPALVPAAACDYTTGYLAALGTLIALSRRAREGGSWHVRASLAQTGMWLHRLGRSGDVERSRDAAPLSRDEIESWSLESETPWGRLRHLGPCVELSETPARWVRPTVPLGTHPPRWPDPPSC